MRCLLVMRPFFFFFFFFVKARPKGGRRGGVLELGRIACSDKIFPSPRRPPPPPQKK